MAKPNSTRDLFDFANAPRREVTYPCPSEVRFTDGTPTAYRILTLEEAAERAEEERLQAQKNQPKRARLKKAVGKIEIAERKQRARKAASKLHEVRSLAVLAGFAPNNHMPTVRLGGRWLAEAGFAIGGRVRVEVKYGKLIITPEEGD